MQRMKAQEELGEVIPRRGRAGAENRRLEQAGYAHHRAERPG